MSAIRINNVVFKITTGQRGPIGQTGPPVSLGPDENYVTDDEKASLHPAETTETILDQLQGEAANPDLIGLEYIPQLTSVRVTDALGYVPLSPTIIQESPSLLPSTVLVRDNFVGAAPMTVALAGTRNCLPGPGVMRVGSLPGTSRCDISSGLMTMTLLPTGSAGAVGVTYGAFTVAAGLTMMAEVTVMDTPGALASIFVGFSHSANSGGLTRGSISSTMGNSPHTENLLFVSRLNDASDGSPYDVGVGIFKHKDRARLCVNYVSPTHQRYYIQGGKTSSFGCRVGSDNWFLIGESFADLTGLTVYPQVACQYNDLMAVHEVQVLSQWEPSPRHYGSRVKKDSIGIHIPSINTDPVSGLVVVGWNDGESHWATGATDIKAIVKLTDGTWTAEQILVPSVVAPAQIHISSLSIMGGNLYLCWISAIDRATNNRFQNRAELTINATTGIITVGATQAMDLGVAAPSASPMNPIITLASGRLYMPHHNSPGVQPMYSYSNDNGATWTSGTISATPNLVEGSFIEESDGAVGCVMRSLNGALNTAYYSRTANPNDVTPTWSTPVALATIPQPAAGLSTAGNRMTLHKLANGQILLIGSDSKSERRNLAIWKMGDNGAVLGKIPIGDLNSDLTVAQSVLQYPVIHQDGDDILFAYSFDQLTAISIKIHTWKWAEAIAVECGGTGIVNHVTPTQPFDRITARLLSGTTPTPNLDQEGLFEIRLVNSSGVVGIPLNPRPWAELVIVVIQAGSGSYTIAWNAVFEFNDAVTTLQTGVNRSNIFKFIYNGYTSKWVLTSFV